MIFILLTADEICIRMWMQNKKECLTIEKNFSAMNSTSNRRSELLALIESLVGYKIDENTPLSDLPFDCTCYDFAVVFGNWADVSIYTCQNALLNSQTVGDFIEKLVQA